jgi:hypothetical protein
MLGLRFLLLLALRSAMFVLRPVQQFCATVAKSVADARLVRARDTFLKSKFGEMTKILAKNFDCINPEHEHSDTFEVVAVMPTPSIVARLQRRDEADATAIFCVSKMCCKYVKKLIELPMHDVLQIAQMSNVTAFTAITNPEYYDTIVLIMMSQFAKDLKPDIMRIIADYYAHEYRANFIAFWCWPGTRAGWMHDGINTPSDTEICFDAALKEFHGMCDEQVDAQEPGATPPP